MAKWSLLALLLLALPTVVADPGTDTESAPADDAGTPEAQPESQAAAGGSTQVDAPSDEGQGGDLLFVMVGGGTEGFYYVFHDQGSVGNYYGGEPQYITLCDLVVGRTC